MSDKNQFALVAINMAELEQALIEAGDMTPEIQEKLNAIAPNIDLSAAMMDRCEVHSEYFRKKAQAYAAIANGYERAESYLRQMIKDDMIAHNVTELMGKDVRFKLSPSKPKLVIDEKNLDPQYIMHVPEPDKRKIEEAFELGLSVKGAHREESKSLRIYLNKKVE